MDDVLQALLNQAAEAQAVIAQLASEQAGIPAVVQPESDRTGEGGAL